VIKHFVFWELLDEAEGRPRAENARVIKEALESMGEIPGVLRLEVSYNAKVDALSREVDLMLYSEHESWEALQAYQAHPEHKKVITVVRPLRKNRWAVDFEV